MFDGELGILPMLEVSYLLYVSPVLQAQYVLV